ncbi:unnamed protein product, partial [Ixodes pacificus]
VSRPESSSERAALPCPAVPETRGGAKRPRVSGKRIPPGRLLYRTRGPRLPCLANPGKPGFWRPEQTALRRAPHHQAQSGWGILAVDVGYMAVIYRSCVDGGRVSSGRKTLLYEKQRGL